MTADQITLIACLMTVEAIERMEYNRRKSITVLPVVNPEGQLESLLRLRDFVQAGLA
jgi:arabinose-5-phosphate isomerase